MGPSNLEGQSVSPNLECFDCFLIWSGQVVISFIASCFLPSVCRAVIGELDEDLDSEIVLDDIRADPLNPVVH